MPAKEKQNSLKVSNSTVKLQSKDTDRSVDILTSPFASQPLPSLLFKANVDLASAGKKKCADYTRSETPVSPMISSLQRFLRLHHLLLEPLPLVPCYPLLSWKFSLMAIATIRDNFLGILGCSISCSGYEGQLTAGKLYLNREEPYGGIICRVTCMFFHCRAFCIHT